MFGFKKVEHRSFKKNFLKTVIFHIAFDKNVIYEEKKEEIINLFIDQFPRKNATATNGLQISFNSNQTPIFQEVKESDGLEMKSDDGQKVININSNSFSLTISGRVYKDFNSFKDDLNKLEAFLSLCSIKEVKRLAIRKINIVEFKISENPCDILTMLINPDLLGNLNYFPNPKNIKHNIQSLNYKNENHYLNIKYGLNILPQPSEEIGQVLIDIDLFNTSKVNIKDVFVQSDEINSEIFNIFNWVISENTLNLLNEKP